MKERFMAEQAQNIETSITPDSLAKEGLVAVQTKANLLSRARTKYILPAVSALGILAAACGGHAEGHTGIEVTLTTPTPTATAVAETATPKATATLGAFNSGEGKVATPETKTENKGILSEEALRQAVRIPINIEGRDYTYIGIKDLPENTPIRTPKIGFFTTTKENNTHFSGSAIGIYLPNLSNATQKIDIRGVIKIDNLVQRDLKQDEIIGYTTNDKTLDGKYSIIFTITKKTQNGPATDEDALKEIAPTAYQNPIAPAAKVESLNSSTVVFSQPNGAQPVR